MDDQNLTNQSFAPGATPVVPSVPEDITPVETPVTTTTTTTTTSEPTAPIDSIPLSQIEQTPVPATTQEETPVAPEEPSPVAAWPIPEPKPETTVTTTTTTTIPEPFATPIPTPTEPAMPGNKPKSKLMPVIGGIAAFLLVVGVAGAAYYVSNQLSTKQAVAPTAPTSKPSASGCQTSCSESERGAGACTLPDGSTGITCVWNSSAPETTTDTGTGNTTTVGNSCDSTTITNAACRGASVGDAVCYHGVSLVCTRGTGTACGAVAGNPSACGGTTNSGINGGCVNDSGCSNGKMCFQGACYVRLNGQCDVNANCLSGVCSNNVCTTGKSGPGGPCENISDCLYGTCSNGLCVGSPTGTTNGTRDGTCTIDSDCSNGKVCVSGVCYVRLNGQCDTGANCMTNYCNANHICTAPPTSNNPTQPIVHVDTTTCSRGGTPACFVSAPSPDSCTQTGFKSACGWECCADRGSVCCCEGCFPAGTDCSQHACAASSTCDESKRDTPKSKQITFAKSGSVIPFMRDPGYAGTITLSKTGATPISIPFNGNGAALELTPFTVTAGDVYTIKVVITSDTGESYGWIPNKSANICGPVKAPGASIDANNKATGSCGPEVDISALKTLAAKTDMTGITADGADATVQCWGDAAGGDGTADYDYDDYTLAFGYAQTNVGACTLINIYKKVDGVYQTTALTADQLKGLKVGDVLKFGITANADSLRGRFRVTVAGTAGSWLDGTVDTTNKKLITYSDYTVATAGTYSFEGQVTTAP